MKKIVVTGGSGKAGRAAIRELLDHGYEVLNLDIAPPAENLTRFRQLDLTDYGATFAALYGYDAVVHMAANPAPDGDPQTAEARFRGNTGSLYNIFNVATALGMPRVVWASSETVLGLPFTADKLTQAPVDETQPYYPESSYALSKVISETMAEHFHRWFSGTTFIGLRFSNIMDHTRGDYERFRGFWGDPHLRKWNLWGYVDARDVGQSCRLGLEADITGSENFIIAAGDTVMTTPNARLMEQVFPGVPLRDGVGEYETLLSVDKARRMLGYDPQHSWRHHLTI